MGPELRRGKQMMIVVERHVNRTFHNIHNLLHNRHLRSDASAKICCNLVKSAGLTK